MVYGVIQLETCLANDTSRFPDLGPKDELVGYNPEGCDGLRSAALFATDIYQSAGFIQVDSVCDEINTSYLTKSRDINLNSLSVKL